MHKLQTKIQEELEINISLNQQRKLQEQDKDNSITIIVNAKEGETNKPVHK